MKPVISVMNSEFFPLAILETYDSIIWTDRFDENGDFEIYIPYSKKNLDLLSVNNYITNSNSDRVMIVENLSITEDVEKGIYITASGRSLESILDRRIIWGSKTLLGNLEEAFKTIIYENIINPTDSKRRINNFIFRYSYDRYIENLEIEAQYTGSSLYEIISENCIANGIGFKIILESGNFVFSLYSGRDRSDEIVISRDFENLVSDSYSNTSQAVKNATLIYGEQKEDGSHRVAMYDVLAPTGILRKEVFTDASSISSKDENGNPISDSDYDEMLETNGAMNLLQNYSYNEEIEAEIYSDITYILGEDYFIGDTVTIVTSFGLRFKVRMLEIIMSDDENGYTTYPSYEILY